MFFLTYGLILLPVLIKIYLQKGKGRVLFVLAKLVNVVVSTR